MFRRSEASALQMSSEGHVKTVRYMNKTSTMIRSSSRATKRCAVPGEASTQRCSGPRGRLPRLSGNRVLDLGCGFGHHCRWMREQGAASVVGVDLSEGMLERARAMTSDSAIEYGCCAIEDLNLAPTGFELGNQLAATSCNGRRQDRLALC